MKAANVAPLAPPAIHWPAIAHFARAMAAALCWLLFGGSVVVGVIGAGWLVLSVVRLGSFPSSGPTAPSSLLVAAVLIAAPTGLAWLITRFAASWRQVGRTIGLAVLLVAIVEPTWGLSNPEQALYYARMNGWGASNVGGMHDSQTFPQRVISTGPSAYHFPQSLSPQRLANVQWQQDGTVKQASLNDFLAQTQSTALIVVRDGVLINESYANGYGRDSMNTSFSVAKSFTSALVGIAVSEGDIGSVNDRIVDYLPELRGKGLDGVTIRNLLTMSAGLDFAHQADQPPPLNMLGLNDDTRTTYYPNMRSVALSERPGADAPGAAFDYNKKVPQLLGLILERTTHRSVSQFLQDKIWQPLGMEYPASWSLDSTQSGFERMESGLNARAIDFAKFGQLYLDNGTWNGVQVVPSQWVSDSTVPGPSDSRIWRTSPQWKAAGGYYGYLWWGRTRPDGSYAYFAWGDQGQFIYVSPRDRVVIVRTGVTSGGVDSWPDVLQTIVDKLPA